MQNNYRGSIERCTNHREGYSPEDGREERLAYTLLPANIGLVQLKTYTLMNSLIVCTRPRMDAITAAADIGQLAIVMQELNDHSAVSACRVTL